MNNKNLYRITFSNQDSVYELYVRNVRESDIFGFLEIEDFVFGETTSLVVDPSEERLKLEFNDVKCALIPMHSVFRIDVVNQQGVAKIRDKTPDSNKITVFPVPKRPKE